MMVVGLDHVQLALPPGGEPEARAFYGGLLGLAELPKPEPLAARGGLWFACGALQVHLGVEPDFRPAKKAHPAFRVRDLAALTAALRAEGFEATRDEAMAGVHRAFTSDPFGNRIELIQTVDGPQGAHGC